MKFVFRMTSFVGLLLMICIMLKYISEKQFETAFCWALCAAMMICCWYYEHKADELLKLNHFFMTTNVNEIQNNFLKSMMSVGHINKDMWNKTDGTDKTDGNGREQE